MTELVWADIRPTVRLEDVLTDLGIDPVPATSRGWQNSSCPLPTHHGHDTSPSFGVNEESLSYKCWACDEKGNLVRLVEVMRGVSTAQALSYLSEFSDVDLDEESQLLAQIDRYFEEKDKVLARTEVPLPYFHPEALQSYPYARLGQLSKWGLKDPDTVRTFGVRYSAEHVRGTYCGPALIIPHYSKDELIGWQERWLTEDRPSWLPKYTNTSDFPRVHTLYNYDRATSFNSFVPVVESVPTVWRLFELGFTAVATFGSAVSQQQQRLMRVFEQIVVALDGDARKMTRELSLALQDTTAVYLLPELCGVKTDLADLDDATICKLMNEIRYSANIND